MEHWAKMLLKYIADCKLMNVVFSFSIENFFSLRLFVVVKASNVCCQ